MNYFSFVLFVDNIKTSIGQQLYYIGESYKTDDADKKRLIQDAITEGEEIICDYIGQADIELRDMLAGYMKEPVDENVCYSDNEDDEEKIVIDTTIPKGRFPSYVCKNIEKLAYQYIVSKSIALFFFNVDTNISAQWSVKSEELLSRIGTDMNKRVNIPPKRKLSIF